MKGRTDVRTYGRTYVVRTDVDDVMAIKPNFLTSMGYHIFLTMVLRARGAPLLHIILASFDRGDNYARIFFADFSKGFDLVDHNALTEELKHMSANVSFGGLGRFFRSGLSVLCEMAPCRLLFFPTGEYRRALGSHHCCLLSW